MIAEIWPILVTIGFIIIWSVRLEAKTMSCKENIDSQKGELILLRTKVEAEHNKISDKFDTVYEALSGIKQSLARIEERLKN
jgi:hypothetical protein